jgi:sigma-B regulation protein RsbU (phosphoserine phosphatase)
VVSGQWSVVSGQYIDHLFTPAPLLPCSPAPLLPYSPTPLCIPARGISRDYYDVLELADGRVVFAIADISGKGISAAILMANVQALLRALTQTVGSPREVCARINQHLHQVTDSSRFATFFYGEWDAVERQLTYVNAGHHPPVVQRYS